MILSDLEYKIYNNTLYIYIFLYSKKNEPQKYDLKWIRENIFNRGSNILY